MSAIAREGPLSDAGLFAAQALWAPAHVPLRMAGRLAREWFMAARPAQYPLPAAPARWLVIGGRGSGKTRLGAEWVRALVHGLTPFAPRRYGRLALVGETLADAREVMVEGESGLLAICGERQDRPRYEASRRRVVWSNGAVAQLFSSEDPESLRGPQFDAAWCDEIGKWNHARAVWDMLSFGLRLGEEPRLLATTTPRPVPLMKALLVDPSFRVTRMKTAENAANLAPSFLRDVETRYGGTRLGRQELEGEMIEDRADALWSREQIEDCRAGPVPAMQRIVVAVDPPAGAGKRSDACGIVAAGLDETGGFWVLADASVQGLRPDGWARRATTLYREMQADALIAEANQGGAMVESVLRTVDPGVPVTMVHAARGKYLRAEPVAALYAQGRVRHGGRFPELEDEMADFGPEGLSSARSPDRLDAMVWALNALNETGGGEPRIRKV